MGTTTMLLSDVDRHEVVAPSEFWWLQLLHQFHLRSCLPVFFLAFRSPSVPHSTGLFAAVQFPSISFC
jgi:hypothetical protein